MFQYVFHISDIHIDIDRIINLDNSINILINDIINKGINQSLLVIVGDIFENKTNMTTDDIHIFDMIMNKLNNNKITTLIVVGNHDFNINSTHKTSIEVLIQHYTYIKCLVNTQVYCLENIQFFVYSILDKKIPNDPIDSKKISIALLHESINGASYDNDQMITGQTYSINDFRQYNITMLGDIHKPQFLTPTIAYCGSFIQKNKGEGIDHGYILWDLNNKTGKHVFISLKQVYLKIMAVDDKCILPVINDNQEVLYLQLWLNKCTETYTRTLSDQILIKYKRLDKIVDTSIIHDTVTNVENHDNCIKQILKDYALPSEQLDDIINFHNTNIQNHKINNHTIYRLNHMTWSNVLCYGDKNYINFNDFKKSSLILINGKNKSGKSSVIDILLRILFNECIRGLKSDIINKKEKTGYIKLSFDSNGKTYIVEQLFYNKDNCIHRLYEDNINITKKSINDTYNHIKYVIGVGDCKDFVNLTTALQYRKFLVDLTKDEFYIMFSKLLNLDNLETILKNIKIQIIRINQDMKKYNEELFELNEKINLGEKSIGKFIEFINLSQVEEHINNLKEKNNNINKLIKVKYDTIQTLNISIVTIPDIDLNGSDFSKTIKPSISGISSIKINTNSIKINPTEILKEYIDIKSKLLKFDTDNLLDTDKELFNSLSKLDTDKELNNSLSKLYKELIPVNNFDKELYTDKELNNSLSKLDKLSSLDTDNLCDKLSLLQLRSKLYIKKDITEERKQYLLTHKFDTDKELNNSLSLSDKLSSLYNELKPCDLITYDSLELTKEEEQITDTQYINMPDYDIPITFIKNYKYNKEEIIEKLKETYHKQEHNECKINPLLLKNINKYKKIIEDGLPDYSSLINTKSTLEKQINMYDLLKYNDKCDCCSYNKKMISDDVPLDDKKTQLSDIIILLENRDTTEENYNKAKEHMNKIETYNNLIQLNKQIDENNVKYENMIKLQTTLKMINYIEMKKKNDMIYHKEQKKLQKHNKIIYDQINEIKDYEDYLYLKDLEKLNKLEIEYSKYHSYITNAYEELMRMRDYKEYKKLTNKLEHIQYQIKEHNYIINKQKNKLNLELDKLNEMNININKNIYEISIIIAQLKIHMDRKQYIDNKLLKNVKENNFLSMYKKCISSKNGIPKHMINQLCLIINKRCNDILHDVADFELSIMYDKQGLLRICTVENNTYIPASMASGYQKFLIDLILRIVIISTLSNNKSCNISNSGMMIIDEGFGSLDKQNFIEITKVLKRLKNNFNYIMVITHIDELKTYMDDIINIKLTNKKSKIRWGNLNDTELKVRILDEQDAQYQILQLSRETINKEKEENKNKKIMEKHKKQNELNEQIVIREERINRINAIMNDIELQKSYLIEWSKYKCKACQKEFINETKIIAHVGLKSYHVKHRKFILTHL